jgi:hypothetical protein
MTFVPSLADRSLAGSALSRPFRRRHMIARSLTTLLALAMAFPPLGDAAEAGSKRHKRAMREAPVAAAQPAFRQEPPRMYEVRPGYWISTWGCFTDEGYGRISSCDRRHGR